MTYENLLEISCTPCPLGEGFATLHSHAKAQANATPRGDERLISRRFLKLPTDFQPILDLLSRFKITLDNTGLRPIKKVKIDP